MKVPRIALVYLNMGNGHRSIAQATEVELKNIYGPDCQISHYCCENKFTDRYNVVTESKVNAFMYRFYYWITHAIYWDRIVDTLNLHGARESLTDFMQTFQPDIVLVNMPLIASTTEQCLRALKQDPLLLFVVTDPFFVSRGNIGAMNFDRIYVPSDSVLQSLLRHGFSQQNLEIIDYPIRPIFYQSVSPEKQLILRRKYDLPPEKKLVLFMAGAAGVPNAEKFARHLISSSQNDSRLSDFIFLFLTGNNKKQFETLLNIVGQNSAFRVFEFLTDVHELLLICDVVAGKSGPAAIHEALASGRPYLIVSSLFGQEVSNIHHLINNGLGDYIPEPEKLVRYILNPPLLEKMTENVRKLPVGKGARDLAEKISAAWAKREVNANTGSSGPKANTSSI